MTESKIALVTGGAGFIGSHIAEFLLGDGWTVRVLDNLSTGKRENLPPHPALEFIEGDVADDDLVSRAVAGTRWVFHEAAVASVPRTIADPVGSQKTNYAGTLNVLEAARTHRVGRVIFAASAAAYGDVNRPPLTEDMPDNPLSPYAVDKLASEYCCRMYHRLHGLETVALRYFNVYGPRQDPSSPYSGVISIFVDKLLKKERPVIYGDGNQTRDFVYIKDVVAANLRAATSKSAPGTVLNIGVGKAVTLNELLQTLDRILDVQTSPEYQPVRTGDIRDSWANIDRARRSLDWEPKTDLETGLRYLLESERA